LFIIIGFALSWKTAVGFLIGAIASFAAGYIGMRVSVLANVRTAEAAKGGLAKGLSLAFKGGSVTGMIVAGLALTAVAGCFTVLLASGTTARDAVIALVALGFGGSLISIFARLGGGIFTKGPMSVPISWVKLKPEFRKTTRATRRLSPTMSGTMWAIAPEWRPICLKPMR
jgi:K(+)-stimulated pyrophosphate-energized sodium pump